MDKQSPTTYGTKYIVATGPYMIKSDLKTGQFQDIGYQTGKSADPGPQPELERETTVRTAAGIPQPDQHQHRRRCHRDRAAGAEGH